MIIVDNTTDLKSVDYLEGAMILVDKPMEWSSFSVVNKMRWVLRHHYNIKKIKVGHGGTLDPLATGLLTIFTGKATKQINEMMVLDKSYAAKIKFGFETASYDAEQVEENEKDVSGLTEQSIREAMKAYEGEIEQLAPVFSALKQNGQPMYKKARLGIKQERKSRSIKIDMLMLNKFASPFADIYMECSKGTYVRSLAHDLGQSLKVGGYLAGLERTAIGEYNVSKAITVDQFVSAFEK